MAASLSQHFSRIRTPLGGEKVHKDECVYSFDTPECDTGLYVCLNTFLGFGKGHVERHFRKTGNAVYLHLRRIKKEIPKPEDTEEPEKKKPTKLAIGIEGGFDVDEKKYEYEDHNSIVILPEWTEIPLPNPDLPEIVQMSVSAILAADSASKLDEAAALAGTWDGEKKTVSKYAENLQQLPTDKKIPPKGWKCEKCDLTQNLWLNLTDGAILCGRRFFDGSGGNNHAVDHYAETKYPLCVKLGTITPDGADVYSYAPDEDDMVEDPYLAKHLAHFGINIAQLEKTDKTMVELEIDLNQKIGEWDVIQESGSKLTPMFGPGCTGMVNLGNSCYMNSVMQVLFTIPDFQKKYAEAAETFFTSASNDPTADFGIQMAKLGCGLLSGDYSKQPDEEGSGDLTPKVVKPIGIRPNMFKTLIGKGHVEFSTKRQQDAQEFILHLFSVIERNCRNSSNPTDCLKFEVEEKIQCIQSGKVKYTNKTDFILAVPIDVEMAINKDEVAAYEAEKKELESKGEKIDPKRLVRPRIPLSACLESFAAAEIVDDFFSTALQAKSVAQKTTRLSTFPDYLLLQLKKFTIGEGWVPKKLDVSVDIPEELDISMLRGHGKQPGEEELPESAPPAVQLDDAVVDQLAGMGFPREACKRAVFNTQNQGVEVAMNWVMEHMDDADFAAPFHPPGRAPKACDIAVSEEGIAMIMSMGFTPEQATKALKSTNNNVERAVDWIFSHADELDQPMETESSDAQPPKCKDGPGKYQLVAFISHMGTSTMVGHYVCHIKKEGKWVIFNDEKVALSENPPKDLAYLYLYERVH